MKNQKISDLKPADYNPRKISRRQLQMLKKSMKEFGDLSGIVFNKRTGNLIGGHQRVKVFDNDWPIEMIAATDQVGTIAIGKVKTPYGDWLYRMVDWPIEKEKAANLAANKHGGDWDEDLLKGVLQELDEIDDFNLDLSGFSTIEAGRILDPSINKAGKKKESADRYDILIMCDSESDREILKERLETEGIKYKILE